MGGSLEKLSRLIKGAFYLSRSGRPGPILLDIPKDITLDICEFCYPDGVDIPTYKPKYKGNKKQIEKGPLTRKILHTE